MIFVRDTFNGPAESTPQGHVPELGSPPQLNTATPNGTAKLTGNFQMRGSSPNDGLFYYPTPPPVSDYKVTATLRVLDHVGSVLAGICARLDSTTFTAIIARYENPNLRWALYTVSGGTVLGSAFSSHTAVDGDANHLELKVIAGTATFTIDGSTILTLPTSTVANAGHAGFELDNVNAFTLGIVLEDFTAQTITTPPLSRVIAQLQPGNVTAVYTPATGSSLSNLTIWLPARNLVIRGPDADTAWAWIVQNTPPDLVFKP